MPRSLYRKRSHCISAKTPDPNLPNLNQEKEHTMLTTAFVLAALAIPYALELYFDMPEEESVEEEYIPDGR